MTAKRENQCPVGMVAGAARRRRREFTLLEVVLAVSTAAVLLSGLVVAFAGTMHARERTHEATRAEWLRSRCLHVMHTDLYHMLTPDGLLAGGVNGAAIEEDGLRRDTLAFDTATNQVHVDVFGCDVLRVAYLLQADDTAAEELPSLVRQVWRNPLSLIEEDPQEVILLESVRSLTIEYYDGTGWVSAWDTDLQDNALPRALRVAIEQVDGKRIVSLQVIVPVFARQPETLAQENGGGESG